MNVFLKSSLCCIALFFGYHAQAIGNNDSSLAVPVNTQFTVTADITVLANSSEIPFINPSTDRFSQCRLSISASNRERVLKAGNVFVVSEVTPTSYRGLGATVYGVLFKFSNRTQDLKCYSSPYANSFSEPSFGELGDILGSNFVITTPPVDEIK